MVLDAFYAVRLAHQVTARLANPFVAWGRQARPLACPSSLAGRKEAEGLVRPDEVTACAAPRRLPSRHAAYGPMTSGALDNAKSETQRPSCSSKSNDVVPARILILRTCRGATRRHITAPVAARYTRYCVFRGQLDPPTLVPATGSSSGRRPAKGH